jgi:penicillin-binding protein 1A
MDAQPNDQPPREATPSVSQRTPADDAASTPPGTPRARAWKRKLGFIVLYGAALAVAAGFTTASWWWSCGWQGCPSTTQLRAWRPTEGGALYGQDGAFVSALSPVKRVNVPLGRVPRVVQASFIAVEDRRFRSHDGVDWQGVARAIFSNLRAGTVREGASTITMQLARNVFLGNRATERSWGRKLLEWRYAVLLEQALSKDEILERYLNAIYLGNGVYGVEAASRDLFAKGVGELTLADAALLAGLPKAPSSYTPRNDRRKALARRNVVFDVLLREHVADSALIATARRAPIRVVRNEFTPSRQVDSWAVEAVRVTLDSLREAGVIPKALNDAQLRVWTTVDRRAQIAAERAVAAGASQIDQERIASGFDIRGAGNRTQGALVALDPFTGAIKAIVGGRRIERRGFNRALRAKRQPGSTFKPFVYAAALQDGFTAASMVEDEPVEVPAGRDMWRPANYGDDYAGRITLRDALARSANAATVRVSREVGVERIAGLAHAQGITSDLPLVPALALGAASVTPMELTTAYAAFANGGTRIVPHLVERVEDQFGRVLWTYAPVSGSIVLESPDAFLITSLLQSVVDRGTGRPVRDAGIRGPVAGKTGTTNDGADVWFVGYTPTIVAGLWFGADTPQPLGYNASGGRLAAPMWARFLRDGWHSPDEDEPWATPMGIETTQIDIGTGKLASDWCGPSRKEYFRTGTVPRQSCEDDQTIAMRDAFPPDWHESVPPPPFDAAEIRAAVDGALEAARASEKVRAVTNRIMSEIKRAAERERDRREPPKPPVPPRR